MMSFFIKGNVLLGKQDRIAYNINMDKRKSSFLILKKYISGLFCSTFFYIKKGLFNQRILNVNTLDECVNSIHKSKMVVFSVNNNNKNVVLERLFDFCNLFGCYGPIVEVRDNDIYFFPKLNYGDVYLIKDMFQKQFVDQKINVIIGRLAI